VGAPLGTLSQKGGFAVAITLGFGFFLIIIFSSSVVKKWPTAILLLP
jgi:hypothetical protein